jgi:hypothetical protein
MAKQTKQPQDGVNIPLWAATGGKIPKSPEEWKKHFDFMAEYGRQQRQDRQKTVGTVVDDATWLKHRGVGDLHRGEFKTVHTSYLRLVDDTVKTLAARLGITPPPIRWHSDTPRNGWVVTGVHEINLSVDVATDWPRGWKSLHWLIAHELRHVWQDANSRFLGDRDAEERDAEEWATSQTGYKGAHPFYLRKQQ